MTQSKEPGKPYMGGKKQLPGFGILRAGMAQQESPCAETLSAAQLPARFIYSASRLWNGYQRPGLC